MKTLKVTLPILIGFLYLGTPIFGQNLDKTSTKSIDLIWGVKIPLRDGIKLNATVYKPKGAGPPPILRTHTIIAPITFLRMATSSS
jgi:predicted acyl esterase